MHSITTLLLLLISALSSLAAPGRNLTSLASVGGLPYPNGYSMKNCPANGNAWSNGQSQTSPQNVPRSFAVLKNDRLTKDESLTTRLHPRHPFAVAPSTNSKRQQQTLCSSVASQSFNYNGVGSGYSTADVLLQAGIQYVVSFSSNSPVRGVTVFQEAVGTALSHVVSHPNFAQAASGTLTFTLNQASNVWMVLKFAAGTAAQGQLGIFALNTPSDLNIEAGSGGL